MNHVDCLLPWSTKETSDNPHTKGSIKIKNCALIIDQQNCATIQKPTAEQIARLGKKKPIIRIVYGITFASAVESACDRNSISFERKLLVKGDCGADFTIAQLQKPEDLTVLALATPEYAIRVLMPNETYYHFLDQTDQDEMWEPAEDEQDD